MADAPNLPSFMRTRIERAIDDAVNPRGMSVHNGMAQVHSSDLAYLLTLIDKLRESSVGVDSSRTPLPAFQPPSTCRGQPGECAFNGACMYACGVTGLDSETFPPSDANERANRVDNRGNVITSHEQTSKKPRDPGTGK